MRFNTRKQGKKVVSLSEHKSMMEMLKVLYGNDGVDVNTVKVTKDSTQKDICYNDVGNDKIIEI